MKTTNKVIAMLLTIIIMISLVPIIQTHVHASGWDTCEYCGEYRSEDDLCSICGGCNENISNDCYYEHHCPGCGECFDGFDGRCQYCWLCEGCVENICPECNCCEVCNVFPEYCEDCSICTLCLMDSNIYYCYTCNVCAECGGDVCVDCGRACSLCSRVCTDCHTCETCNPLGYFCADCGRCLFCSSGTWCASCELCDDCVDAVCPECFEACTECSTLCPDCDKCINCVFAMCEICDICSECGEICENCGAYCSNCVQFCEECNLCENCVDLCPGCSAICSDCGNTCAGCGFCENCATICIECGYSCSNCGEICPNCNEICESCARFCYSCGECEYCKGDFCENCGEYCSECALQCEDCGVCENCVNLCPNCNTYCSGCKEFCKGCGLCEECVTICDLCGEHCNECGGDECEFCDMPMDCKYHGWCDLCNMCLSDPGHLICPDCGEHWFSHRTLISKDDHYHQKTCTCGTLFGELEGHYITYEVIEEPTETLPGIGRYYCHYHTRGCGYYEDIEIPAIGSGHVHDYSLWMPTISGHNKMCACGDIEPTFYPHENIIKILEEPTESKSGLGCRHCTVCGRHGALVIIPAIDHTHNYSDTWCYDKTEHWYECSCGSSKDRAMHDISPWIITKVPTLTTAGSKERTCTVCPYTETVIIAALGEEVAVTFDSQGGSPVLGQIVDNGQRLTRPSDPTKEGYSFVSWFTSTDFIEEWKFANPVYGNMTLYAKWAENSHGPPVVKTTSLPDGFSGVPYSVQLQSLGGKPVRWSLDPSGTPPQWLALSEDGILSGTPLTTGQWDSIVVTVTNDYGSDTKTLDLLVKPFFFNITVVNGRANMTKARKGELVTITAKTISGYKFREWEILEGEFTILDSESSVTSFMMPEEDVVINAMFDKKPQVPADDKNDKGHKEEDLPAENLPTEEIPAEPGTDLPDKETIEGTLPFIDVQKNDWFHDSVEFVYNKGLMSGTGSDLFSPNAEMTRGMITTILYRLEGSPVFEASNLFTDVEEGMWYTDGINWAGTNNIVDGYPDGRFGHSDNLTREQLVTILYNYAKYKGMNVSSVADLETFNDKNDISPYALEPMRWAVKEGIIIGTGNNMLSPKMRATRAQLATMLQRFIEK